MDNKNTQNLNKREKLLQEIHELEVQMTEVKRKMHTLENKEKRETYKNNLLEVKKDNLKCIIVFYEKYLKKMNNKLAEKQTTVVTLSMADEYYDKLLEIYREKHFQQGSSFVESLLLEGNSTFQNQIDYLEKQAEQITTIIEMNSATIENLKKILPVH